MGCYLQQDFHAALLITFGVIAGVVLAVVVRWVR